MLLDGVVEAVNQATLSAQTAGRVAEVPVDVNDTVKAGALLMRLRATEQVAGLGQAQAALQAATAQDAQARAQFDRIRDMYERKVVARCDLRRSRHRARRRSRESARRRRPGSNRRAKASRTPSCGRRTTASSRPGTSQAGEAVAPGMPLADRGGAGRSCAWSSRFRRAWRTRSGQLRQAHVYVGDESVAAARSRVYPAADPQSGHVPRARRPAGDRRSRWRRGCTPRSASPPAKPAALLVPRSAVVERSELRAVYVVTPEGRVVLRQVRLGRPLGDQIEVIAGLAQGERVATDPAAAGVDARPMAADT